MRFIDALRRFWRKFLANLKTNRAPLDMFGELKPHAPNRA